MIRSGFLLLSALLLPAAEDTEFFEKRIRPVLAERCYGCHSAQVKEPKADLRLDAPLPAALQDKLLQAIYKGA